jgi:hypothetical protein
MRLEGMQARVKLKLHYVRQIAKRHKLVPDLIPQQYSQLSDFHDPHKIGLPHFPKQPVPEVNIEVMVCYGD